MKRALKLLRCIIKKGLQPNKRGQIYQNTISFPYFSYYSLCCFVRNAVPTIFKSIPQSLIAQLAIWDVLKMPRGIVAASSFAGLDRESGNLQVKCGGREFPNHVEQLYTACCSLQGRAAECLYNQPFWFKASVWCLFPRYGKGSWEGIKGALLTNASASSSQSPTSYPWGIQKWITISLARWDWLQAFTRVHLIHYSMSYCFFFFFRHAWVLKKGCDTSTFWTV